MPTSGQEIKCKTYDADNGGRSIYHHSSVFKVKRIYLYTHREKKMFTEHLQCFRQVSREAHAARADSTSDPEAKDLEPGAVGPQVGCALVK